MVGRFSERARPAGGIAVATILALMRQRYVVPLSTQSLGVKSSQPIGAMRTTENSRRTASTGVNRGSTITSRMEGEHVYFWREPHRHAVTVAKVAGGNPQPR